MFRRHGALHHKDTMQTEIRNGTLYISGDVTVKTLTASAFARYEQQCRLKETDSIDFSQVGKPFILAGDFNNPAGQEGYETILSSSLKLQDSFIEAKETKGTYTVGPGIDGWTDNQVPLRIDYVFASPEWDIQRLHVIFDGQNKAHVSDHYGLEAELSL